MWKLNSPSWTHNQNAFIEVTPNLITYVITKYKTVARSLTASKIKLLIRKPSVRQKKAHGVDEQQQQPTYKSIQAPALRQAVGPTLNQTGQAVTTRDLVFFQINSDKGEYISSWKYWRRQRGNRVARSSMRWCLLMRIMILLVWCSVKYGCALIQNMRLIINSLFK